MKKILFSSVLALLFAFVANAETNLLAKPVAEVGQSADVQALAPEMLNMQVSQFLEMTPAKYEKMTGERLGFKNTVKMKLAQKALKKQIKKNNVVIGEDGGDGITKGLYILLAILGLAWVAMGVKDDWSGSDWIINLVLTALCWLPGLIHALVKMKKYYS